MTYSIVEQIAQELYTRLDALAADDSTYATKVSKVVRPEFRSVESPAHLTIFVEKTDDVRAEEYDVPGNPPGVGRLAVFNVHCHAMDERETDSADAVLNQFARDVTAAITEGSSGWYSMGSLAIDSEMGDLQKITPGNGLTGFTLPVSVWYRISELDPYVSRL